MIQTLILPWPTCVRCGGSTGPEITAGDVIVLLLRGDAFAGIVPQVPAAVVLVDTPVEATTTRIYTLSYDTDDLLGTVEILLPCMVGSITCSTGEHLLQEQVDNLDTRLSAAELTLTTHEQRLAEHDASLDDIESAFIEQGRINEAVDAQLGALEVSFGVSAHYYRTGLAGRDVGLVAVPNVLHSEGFGYAWHSPTGRVVGLTQEVHVSTESPDYESGTYSVTVTDPESGASVAQFLEVPPDLRVGRVLIVDDVYGTYNNARIDYPLQSFRTLPDALVVARSGDVIQVYSRKASYYPPSSPDGGIHLSVPNLTINFMGFGVVLGQFIVLADNIRINGPNTHLQGSIVVTEGGTNFQAVLNTIWAGDSMPYGDVTLPFPCFSGITIQGNNASITVQELHWRINALAGSACGILISGAADAAVRIQRRFRKLQSSDGMQPGQNNAFVKVLDARRASVISHNTTDPRFGEDGPWLLFMEETVLTIPPNRAFGHCFRFTGITRIGKGISGTGALGVVVESDSIETTDLEYTHNNHSSNGVGLTGNPANASQKAWLVLNTPSLRALQAGPPVTISNNATILFGMPTCIEWTDGPTCVANHTADITMLEGSLYFSGGAHNCTADPTGQQFMTEIGPFFTKRIQHNGLLITAAVDGGLMAAVTGHPPIYGAALLNSSVS